MHDDLERMAVILAFIAVRVLALCQRGLSEETLNGSCEQVLSPVEWKLLWVKQEGKARQSVLDKCLLDLLKRLALPFLQLHKLEMC